MSSDPFRPQDRSDLAQGLAAANRHERKFPSPDLRALNRIMEHSPADMIVSVESGMILGDLQKELARHGQWIPIDPPHADRITVHQLLSENRSGPRRLAFGTIRDHVIGLKAILADGREIKSGGKVVKNVAGFDLAKMFIGARDSLGLIVEATFKLRPLPAAEEFWQRPLTSPPEARDCLHSVTQSSLTPVALDLHNLTPSGSLAAVLGLAGTRSEVEAQRILAQALGFTAPAGLEHEEEFWQSANPESIRHLSVLPSRLTGALPPPGVSFVARAGNGVIYYRGGPEVPPVKLPLDLLRRLKQEYDPKNILPEMPL